jgi:hypothetical protein
MDFLYLQQYGVKLGLESLYNTNIIIITWCYGWEAMEFALDYHGLMVKILDLEAKSSFI